MKNLSTLFLITILSAYAVNAYGEGSGSGSVPTGTDDDMTFEEFCDMGCEACHDSEGSDMEACDFCHDCMCIGCDMGNDEDCNELAENFMTCEHMEHMEGSGSMEGSGPSEEEMKEMCVDACDMCAEGSDEDACEMCHDCMCMGCAMGDGEACDELEDHGLECERQCMDLCHMCTFDGCDDDMAMMCMDCMAPMCDAAMDECD